MNRRDLFEDLFILEIANNHWGDVSRGLEIIRQHSRMVRFNNVRAALKLQFRDVDNFIHKDFRDRSDVRYIKKTMDTKLSKEHYAVLIDAVKKSDCIPMATPFDEASVDLCVEFGLPLIKVASSDINDWLLLERIAATKRPVIVSTGGSSQKDTDDIVTFFERRNIPLAINHCVSLYPTEEGELELNQIDYLKNRYPGHVIGLSTHEHADWQWSMAIAYAKGTRTFERHIDIDAGGIPVSPYCSTPNQIDTWFKAFNRVRDMCGSSPEQKRRPSLKEVEYLDALVRGVYAKRDLPAGHVLNNLSIQDDIYLAIPLQKGQLSCRELMTGETIQRPIPKDSAVMIDDIDSAYAYTPELKKMIMNRGL
jgi:sialic acid synthase SpsE